MVETKEDWREKPITKGQMGLIRYLLFKVQNRNGKMYSYEELTNEVRTKGNASILIGELQIIKDGMPDMKKEGRLSCIRIYQGNAKKVQDIIADFNKE